MCINVYVKYMYVSIYVVVYMHAYTQILNFVTKSSIDKQFKS